MDKFLERAPDANDATAITRRGLLKLVGLGGGGFMIACGLAPVTGALAAAADEPHAFNAFVRVSTDDTVTVIIKHLDKGQGVTTGLTTIVAEEMDAAWSQMRWAFAPADASRYNNLAWGPTQGTGGSSSIRNSWPQLRKAGAMARTMLVAAAAARWDLEPAALAVAAGVVSAADGRRATFGELAVDAATMKPAASPALKSPAAFKLIGHHVPRIDTREKSTGLAVYTIDIDLPGMLHATVVHPPQFGGTLRRLDAAATRAIDGVVDVIEIPTGVAIVARSYWAALKGRRALHAEWSDDAAERRGSDAIATALRAVIDTDGAVAAARGDAHAALGRAARLVEAEFEFPFLAHAAMEPLNAVVRIGDGGCEIWTGCQSQTRDQAAAARILGIDPARVTIHTLFAGGSFGRRATPTSDFVSEAVHIARALGGNAPVKLQWTREDDMRGGYYRPVSLHRLRAGLDADGNLLAWHHRVVGQSFLLGTALAGMVTDGVDGTLVEGARGLPYAVDNFLCDTHIVDSGVPTLWWRSVGHTHNAYATEVFLDEVARAAGRDPAALRLELLSGHPRHRGVLERALAEAGAAPTAPNRGRGVAVHESFRSFVAEVVDVTVADDGSFSVDQVTAAVDCGIAVNPDIVRAQIEGGIGYGLSAVLREAITLTDGAVDQGNFDTYRPLRIDEMPRIDVHIVASGEAPSGVGEPGTPPIGPAVANALLAVTGKVQRRLPIGTRIGTAPHGA